MWGLAVVRGSAAVVVVGAWIGLSGSALALEQPATGECDALLVDAAEELSQAEEADVIAAATAFRTATSFEPRIWVLTQDQDGRDLPEWIDLQTAACDTWHAGSSELTSNFVVMAVTTDTDELTGETYIWYGDAMPDSMDERYPEILADVINPALSDGDFARGLIFGIAAVGDVIDEPAGQPSIDPGGPEQPPGSPTGMYVFGGLVVAGAAGYGGYRWNRARVARERARAELAKRFEAAAAGSDQAVLGLDELAETLDSDVQLVRASFHPEEADELLADVTALLGTYAALTAQRLDLMIARDQVLTDADDATLAQVVNSWEELRGRSEEVLPALAHERDELTAALRLPESIQARVAAIPASVDLVRAAERTARDLEFTPTSEVAPLASVPARITEVARLADERRFVDADRELGAVEDDLAAAHQLLTTLPERLEELTSRVDAAVTRRMALGAKIDDARAAETTLTEQFHPAIAAEVAGSAAGAAEDADRADSALADARAALGSAGSRGRGNRADRRGGRAGRGRAGGVRADRDVDPRPRARLRGPNGPRWGTDDPGGAAIPSPPGDARRGGARRTPGTNRRDHTGRSAGLAPPRGRGARHHSSGAGDSWAARQRGSGRGAAQSSRGSPGQVRILGRRVLVLGRRGSVERVSVPQLGRLVWREFAQLWRQLRRVARRRWRQPELRRPKWWRFPPLKDGSTLVPVNRVRGTVRFPSERSYRRDRSAEVIPETVFGLPFHVLINHGAVVLVPLAALGVIAIAVVPAWRERYGTLVAGLAVIASITTFITVLSGEAFEESQEAKGISSAILEKVEEHAAFGNLLRWYVLALAISAVAFVLLVRRGAAGNVIMIVAVIAVVAAGASIYQVIRTGHSGSSAVWNSSG